VLAGLPASSAATDGIHAVVDVNDVVVFEAAHDVGDGVRLADVAQEGVAASFTLGGAAHEPGDVHEVHRGRHDLRRRVELHQGVEARIGHGHDAHVGIDGAEGVVRCLGLFLRQRVEEGGLAHVGQTDDSD